MKALVTILATALAAFGPAVLAQDQAADINKLVQEKLQQLGFYNGPINGDIGPNTQAALAQFQLSVPVPASGQLDDLTLGALGIEREPQPSPEAASGASAEANDKSPR